MRETVVCPLVPVPRMKDYRADFQFSNDDFVDHQAIRATFKKTRRADATFKKAGFSLADIVVLTTDCFSATETGTLRWQDLPACRALKVQCRRPRVRLPRTGRFRIVHEHLGRVPKPP